MKRNILAALLLPAIMLAGSCTIEEEFFEEPTPVEYRGEPVEAFLNLSVGALSVSTGTRADEADLEDSEAERWVSDLWVFQYNASTRVAVADPIYVDMADYDYDQSILENMPVTLSDNVGDESVIYVVTNALVDGWGTNIDYSTIDKLLDSVLPTREPILVTSTTTELSIPMEGDSGNVTVVKGKSIVVPVSRMYAKIMIDPSVELENAEIYSVGIGNIPLYCRVGPLAETVADNTKAVDYPDNIQWISRTFSEYYEGDAGDDTGDDAGTNVGTGYRYIVYVPENLEGQAGDPNTEKLEQEDEAPGRALQVNIVISHTDSEGGVTNYPYSFYPGADIYADYNIVRNNIYRVKVNIHTLSVARVASANCQFAYAGETISFFPYFRDETGGGYDFEDYLYPTPGDGSGKEGSKIDKIAIIWQTKDCIGDNSDGDLVYLSSTAESHTGYEQIYVKTQKEGNALIGAYDEEGNIIWSWHIWVRDPQYPDPTNIANAKMYYTYYWDETKIYSYDTDPDRDRVSGYQIMSCNLGALQDEPNWDANEFFGDHSTTVQYFADGDGIVRTFGMLYQWGRKDPFPPMTTTIGNRTPATNSDYFNTGYFAHDYNDDHTETHYGNDNSTVVHKTTYTESGPTYSGATRYSDYLFYTHIAQDGEGVRYSIAHPTVFLSGLNQIGYSFTTILSVGTNSDSGSFKNYLSDVSNYTFGGAWSDDDHDNKEWGGLEPDKESEKYLALGIYDDAGNEITLYDDYESGTLGSKSIFDPCPYGWRVGSGDLWLGFTKNGVNPYYDYINGSADTDGSLDNINYDPDNSCLLGLYMYLGEPQNTWRTGERSWFPTQGFRLPDGCGYRVGGCGNYVNANTSSNDRINIIHIHDGVGTFKQFETQLHYTVKSTGNPLRCVRDTH